MIGAELLDFHIMTDAKQRVGIALAPNIQSYGSGKCILFLQRKFVLSQ